MAAPKLILGLGNPGSRYAETRHNAGFWFLDCLVNKYGTGFREQKKLQAEIGKVTIDGQDCLLVKPTTYMNCSGQAARAVMDYYRVAMQDLLVAYDELDLSPGTARLKQGGGHGGHNGMRDLFNHLRGKEFLRLRIGIGHPGHKDAVVGYVLSRAGADDQRAIDTALADSVAVLPKVVAGDVAAAMKQLHST